MYMIKIQYTECKSSVGFSAVDDEVTIYVNKAENKHDVITKALQVIADHKRNLANNTSAITK